MTFQEAEKTYKELRSQYAAGKVSSADFEAEVSKLKLQDAEGRWWQIGVQSGEWYVHDGQKWSKSQPPPPDKGETPTVAPTPAPVPSPSDATPAPKPLSSGSRSKGLPARPFSAAPARSSGGLPIPLIIGIVVVVALIGFGVIYAGYSYLSGAFGSSGNSTAGDATATVSVAGVVRTTVIPTLPPVRPTDTPLPPTLPPTAVITPTVPSPTATITATVAAGTPGTTGTPRPTVPTATRKPAVSPTPSPTKGPAVAPGVYVTKLTTDPAQPNIGEQIQFHVSFLNTTGKVGPGTWFVKIFKCQAACTADELKTNKSVGETPKTTKQILPGNTDLVIGSWSVGVGACTYVASPFYFDNYQNVVPFLKPDGSQLFQLVNVCH